MHDFTVEGVNSYYCWVFRRICEKHSISNYQYMELEELKSVIEDQIPDIHNECEAFLKAYGNWHQMDREIEKEQLWGKLDEEQMSELIQLMDARDAGIRNLEKAVYGL